MKKLLLILAVPLLFGGNNVFCQDYKTLKSEKPSMLLLINDKFEQITWVNTGSMPLGTVIGNSNYGLNLEVYFGIHKDGSITSLRFKFIYIDKSWMFLNGVTFLCGKPAKVRNDQVDPIKVSFKRDITPVRSVNYGTIKEVYDIALDNELQKFTDYYVNGGKFTSTKLHGKDGYTIMGTFGGKLSKKLPVIYEYYLKKSKNI
jgi:hypothetical protein